MNHKFQPFQHDYLANKKKHKIERVSFISEIVSQYIKSEC